MSQFFKTQQYEFTVQNETREATSWNRKEGMDSLGVSVCRSKTERAVWNARRTCSHWESFFSSCSSGNQWARYLWKWALKRVRPRCSRTRCAYPRLLMLSAHSKYSYPSISDGPPESHFAVAVSVVSHNATARRSVSASLGCFQYSVNNRIRGFHCQADCARLVLV